MENQRDSKVPNLKSSGGVISQINVPNFVRGRRFHLSHRSPIYDPYASYSSDSPSPLMKHLFSATVPSSPVFATLLKVEEDVLVIDGIPVSKSNKGGRARVNATLASLNLNSTSSHPGGARAENSNSNKADICLFWEDSGICRYGSKCQFAHGKEELRPPRFSGKNKLEMIFKPYKSSSGSSSSSRGRKSCSVNPIITNSAAEALLVPMPPTPIVSSTYTLEINTNSGSINDSKYPNPALLSSNNWSPLDDGIEVILPLGERQKNLWKEDLEAEIQKALYDTGSTKRLHVFLNICTD